MQTVKTCLLIFVCVALLGACGYKGPLYLPEETPATGQDSAADTDVEKEKKDTVKKKSVSG
jgi:predicted small lipoprotein YifL